jgi:hypothetical protein
VHRGIRIHIRDKRKHDDSRSAPGAGIAWLKQAVNLGRNNPKAVFGGAAYCCCSPSWRWPSG